jgi:hypothetical protein
MATYSTDLNTITLCDSGSFTEFTGFTTGGTPALSTENYIHNGSSVDQATGQAVGQQASIAFDFGSNISWTTGWVVMGWQYFAAPTNIETWASGGMRIGIGSALGAVSFYNAVGNNFGTYPYGGWQNTAIDPTLTADQTTGGGNGGSYRYFGSMCNMLAKITKGSPHAIDAFRYGRGQIKAIGADSTFTGLASANDATTARWGLFSNAGGVYKWKGLMSLGDATNSVTFSDSNKAILIEDTPRVSAGFNKIEITHASSSVTWNSISITGVQTSITGSSPVSRGDFEVVTSGATVSLAGCTFTDMGTFILKSSASITGSTFRRCGTVTPSGATINSGTLFTNSFNTSIGALLVTSPTDIASMSNGSFTNNVKAITITTSGSYNFVGHQFSSNTTAVDFTGTGTCNIYPSAGCNLSQSNCTASGGGTIIVHAVSTNLTLTGIVPGSDIVILNAGTTTERVNIDSNATSTYVFSYTTLGDVDICVYKQGYRPFAYRNYSLPASDGSFPVSQVADLNYFNPA